MENTITENLKVAIPPVIFEQETPVIYEAKSKYVNNWRRRKVGTYPKFLLSPARKFLHFCFNKISKYRIEIVARGRGRRAAIAKGNKLYARCYDQDLPVKLAKKVAIYISIYKR